MTPLPQMTLETCNMRPGGLFGYLMNGFRFVGNQLYSDVLVLIMIYVGEGERILDWRPPNICLALVYHDIRNINHT